MSVRIYHEGMEERGSEDSNPGLEGMGISGSILETNSESEALKGWDMENGKSEHQSSPFPFQPVWSVDFSL
jgi:hypothetical protein